MALATSKALGNKLAGKWEANPLNAIAKYSSLSKASGNTLSK